MDNLYSINTVYIADINNEMNIHSFVFTDLSTNKIYLEKYDELQGISNIPQVSALLSSLESSLSTITDYYTLSNDEHFSAWENIKQTNYPTNFKNDIINVIQTSTPTPKPTPEPTPDSTAQTGEKLPQLQEMGDINSEPETTNQHLECRDINEFKSVSQNMNNLWAPINRIVTDFVQNPNRQYGEIINCYELCLDTATDIIRSSDYLRDSKQKRSWYKALVLDLITKWLLEYKIFNDANTKPPMKEEPPVENSVLGESLAGLGMDLVKTVDNYHKEKIDKVINNLKEIYVFDRKDTEDKLRTLLENEFNTR